MHFFVCLLLFLNPFSEASCPANGIKWLGKCYIFVNSLSQFIPAELACNEQNGHLASVHDGFTNTFIAQQGHIALPDVLDFWIGATNMIQGGNWSWTDGSSWDFSELKGNRTIREGSYCASLISSNGFWNSADCYNEKPYLCKLDDSDSVTTPPANAFSTMSATTFAQSPLVTTPVTSETPTSTASSSICPYTWTYFDKTHSCYFSTRGYWWNTTDVVCRNFGGNLTSIHSEAEHDFINTINPDWKQIGLIRYYINSQNWEWQWIDGSPVTYLQWFINNPWNKTDFTCSVSRRGFAIIDCDNLYKYEGICKIPASSPQPTTTTTEIVPTPSRETKCDNGWEYFELTDSCYLYIPPLNWINANTFCNNLENTKLVSVHSFAEMNFTSHISPKGYGIWTGLQCSFMFDFFWVDGSNATYLKWAFGDLAPEQQLPNYCIGYCAYMQGGTMDTALDSTFCSDYYPALCKKPSFPPSEIITFCPKDWIYFNATKSCYYITPPLAWEKAENYCRSNNAHLTSVHSDAEFYFIYETLVMVEIWIGFYTADNGSSWQWTDNSSVDYTNWGAGYPRSSPDGASYASSTGDYVRNDKFFPHGNLLYCEGYNGICKKMI